MGVSQTASELIWDEEVDSRPKVHSGRPARRRVLPTSKGVWLAPAPAVEPAARSTASTPPRPGLSLLVGVWKALTWSLRALWLTVTLPFRALIWVLALLGRIAGVIIGFALMVGGAALFPTHFLVIGLAVFALGLVMTLRSLE